MVTATPGEVIRLLTSADLEGALTLSSTAGWNQRLDDWRMLYAIAPAGSFAALSGNRIVGTSIGIDYGGFGWIAMMLVEPEWRGRGLGRRLLEAAADAIPTDRPIRLDATPMGRPLYESYGFQEEDVLSRYVGRPDARDTIGTAESHRVRPIAGADVPAVARQDAQVFGGDRRAVLEWAFETAPQYARIARSPGEPAQYCFGRKGRLFDQIGPVVAHSVDAARELVAAALPAAEGRSVVIDAFDSRPGFTAWLRECGFTVERPLYRMRKPPQQPGPAPSRAPSEGPVEFAIFGPEFA
jgi:GNAT superfamily N-acetyltransferase